ncbi:MAG: hypothetical protein A3F87_01385 [Omnitrophica WOR_2 bacterium RIFCSPLOWO2_12_FULL_51_24]|nr:MAG: hypothetical protein A3I43_00745 [Omnitrophica WOR_2 bacterium RIFCSPLOWO2_02_FULL_50_19]OGX42425.1 MAG: hypothetical protein A3F87_01385 [Omnitrophica WOR_2 bacterium RIFCSPLOWO2_12_FULL_51_24]
MTREIKKVTVTLETGEPLTEDEINAIKKSLSGQLIKTLTPRDVQGVCIGNIEAICHVHPNHTHNNIA